MPGGVKPALSGSGALITSLPAANLVGVAPFASIPIGTITGTVADAGAVATALATSQSGFALQNNLSSATRHWHRAMARMRSGGTFAKLALLGDSTARGYGAGVLTNAAGGTNNLSTPYGPAVKLASLLSARGQPAVALNFFGNGSTNSSGDPTIFDSRLTKTGSWGIGLGPSVGGYSIYCPGSGVLTWTVTGPFDTIDFYSYRYGIAGSMSVAVDGGTATTVTPGTGPDSPLKQTISITAVGSGSHTITVTQVSGTPGLVGMDVYLSTVPAIHCWAMGWGGSTSGQWVASTPTASNPIASLTNILKPDLCLYNCGINDWVSSVPVSTYQANLTTFVSALLTANVDVILKTPLPSSAASIPVATQAPYVAAMRAVAVALGVPYIDSFALAGSWEVQTALLSVADTYHPNEYGYGEDAILVANAIMSLL